MRDLRVRPKRDLRVRPHMRDLRVRPKTLNFILVFSKPNLQIFRFTGTDIPSDSQKNGFYILGEQYNF